jgi:hypothetical protein
MGQCPVGGIAASWRCLVDVQTKKNRKDLRFLSIGRVSLIGLVGALRQPVGQHRPKLISGPLAANQAHMPPRNSSKGDVLTAD